MNGLRLWISILALVSFLAGVAAGLVVGEYSRKAPADERFFGDFGHDFVEHFDLDAQRQNHLADLLRLYAEEIAVIKDRYTSEIPAQMEDQLQQVGVEYHNLIRERLLTEDQRPEFDRLMAAYVDNL